MHLLADVNPQDRPAQRLADIDWSQWRPVDPATLLFVIREASREVLLIRKKRGLGAGKINAPGGRIEPGETPVQAAIREVREELGVTALQPRAAGELRFQFVDGYSLHVHVFRSPDCAGCAIETAEAIPLWTPLTAIPYEQMWADDRLWVPMLLERRRFSGRFLFDGDTMLDHAFDPFDDA